MIEVYTPEFLHLRTIAHPKSVKWNIRYNDVGSCEIYLQPQDESIKLFAENDDLIVVQGRLSAWVNGCADDMGGFLVSGRTLNWLTTNRQVLPFDKVDTRERIIRTLVTEQFIAAGNKKVPNFVLGNTIGNTTQTEYELEEYSRSLYDIIKELCEIEKIGFEVYFDYFENKYRFNLIRGIDRTAGTNSPLILSEVNRNFTQTQYLKNNEGYKTAGYLREVEDDETTFTEIIKDSATGFYRRELGLTIEEIELTKAKRITEIDGVVYGLNFGTDFNVGDIVTVQKQVGKEIITQDRRILEVTINQEVGNNSVVPILGEI